MCYDLGEGCREIAHNSIGENNENHYTCKYSIKSYVQNDAITPQKYILGIPFYGRISYTKDPQILPINEIKNFLEKDPYNYKKNTTEDTVSFLYENGQPICSFENKHSLYKKVKMVVENKLGGIMIWNIAQDTKDFYYLKMINSIIKQLQ